ncbi:IscS subfamily cysteine desulfurase [Tuberibacillus sp. Marseille-P3662]|uniref:IscS subfamily cysteine desulfurase n=1 Tax=Tuberibacillus sp. Marseille-P3662 TaxID=1965358 RepID=UPI000A1CA26B|nr:IscS subfamily cysteine desulfurase [Tuberibacillus sp. Marseille-P3662]
MIYMDYAASSPMSDKALQTYIDTTKTFCGNPMSLHDHGSQSRHLLEMCRHLIAYYLGGQDRGVTFTGSGSEANAIAIYGLAHAYKDKGQTILTTGMEHASVYQVLNRLKNEGFCIREIPVDQNGAIVIDALADMVDQETILAVIGHVNSDFGAIQDLETICNILHDCDVLIHSDMVQSFGKITDIPIDQWEISSCAISAHKIYGPKGIGACYIHPELRCKPFLPGIEHENGLKTGTVNLPGIAAFADAADDMFQQSHSYMKHLVSLNEQLTDRIRAKNMPFDIEGDPNQTFPGIMGLTSHDIEGQYLMLACNQKGLAISTGSACGVQKSEPPKALMAIGKTVEAARGFIRLSFGYHTTHDDITHAVRVLEEVVQSQNKLPN